MKPIEMLIKEINGLKPIPQVASQIMTLIENPRSSLSQVAEVIMFEPIISAEILKMCNSAYFGLPRKIDSVSDAISLLGLDRIIDLVLIKCSGDNMNQPQQGYDLNEGELWRHSVSCAIIAKEIAGRKNLENKHLVFTAALLKDIGKVVLNRFVEGAMEKIRALVQDQGMSFLDAEKKIIGIDHAQLGGIVASRWKFSTKMTYIITNHHLPDEKARNDLETTIVYAADIICMMMGIGIGADGLSYRFYKDVIAQLGIDEKDVQIIMAEFGEKLKKVEDLIGMS